MATKIKNKPVVNLLQTIGRTPKPYTMVGKNRELLDWQKQALANLNGELALLTSPTGSGKSMVLRAWACDWLDNGYKVVVIVPANSIKAGFKKAEIVVGAAGHEYDWPGVPEQCFDLNGQDKGLKRFLMNRSTKQKPLGRAGRAYLCTHVTFVAALKDLDPKELRALMARTVVVIDEAHHIANETEAVKGNRLGGVVNTLLGIKVPMLVTTATYMRTDGAEIIPVGHRASFRRFVRRQHEHLADMKFAQHLRIKVLCGNALDILQAELAARKMKTVCWLPNVAGKAKERFDDQIGARVGNQERREDAEDQIRAIAAGCGYDFLSVATDRSVKTDYATIMRQAKEADGGGSVQGMADLVLAQDMLKEGTDNAGWARCVVIGVGGSPVVLLQQIGRALRDHPSKAEHGIEILVIEPAPIDTNDEEGAEWALDTLKTLFVMLIMSWDNFSGATKLRGIPVPARGTDGVADGGGDTLDNEILGSNEDEIRCVSDILEASASSHPEQAAEAAIAAMAKKGLTQGQARTRFDSVARRMLLSAEFEAMVNNTWDEYGTSRLVAEVGKKVRGMAGRLGVRADFTALTAVADRCIGVPIATEEQVREFCRVRGIITTPEYQVECGVHGGIRYTVLGMFQKHYMKTLIELIRGARGDAAEPSWADCVEMARRLASGEFVKYIATDFNRSKPTLYKYAARAGYRRPLRGLSDGKRTEAVRLYNSGLGVSDVARRLSVNRAQVLAAVKSAGVLRVKCLPSDSDVLHCVDSGMTMKDIHATHNVCGSYVRMVLNRAGRPSRKPTFDKVDRAPILEMYAAGNSWKEIQRVCRVSSPTLSRVLREAGLSKRSPNGTRKAA